MDQKNYAFRYPPPPPPNYIPTIIPPLPTDNPPIVQPPPPPPPTTIQNWTNWSVDFSRPPPPVFNGLITGNTTNTMKLGYNMSKKTVVSPSMSPASSTDSSGYYGSSPSDNSQYYGTENRQYRRYNTEQYGSNPSWSPKINFKRPRYETRLDQRGESYDNYAKYNDLKYTRNTTNIDSRYSRDTNNVDLKNNKPSEDSQRSRKRKKPLSQSVPAKRAWTDEEAQMAIVVEREYNKLFKNHSLKIKFPDQELNRDIVSKFHSSIETVYFQQPSNPRFCFVTLADGADPNNVIEQLNKIKFGLGYLSAEYKKDREEEQNVGPDDIDPLTLYVGNLAQEVTKEDMVTFFPKNKRIDIGFAKKMRYTRYAFVSFKNVQDSIEAFKATHYADLHSKSMIVRFRRLHGTVGMPGEAKNYPNSRENQEEKKKEDGASTDKIDGSNNSHHKELDESDLYSSSTSYDPRSSSPSHSPNRINCDRRTTSECSDLSNFDPSLVKSEPYDYSYEDYEDCQVEKTEEHFTPHQLPSEEIKVPEQSSKPPLETTDSDNKSLETVVKKEPEFITPFAPEIPESQFPIRPIPLKEEPNDNEEVNTISPNQQIDEELSLPNGLKEPKVEAENLEPVNPDDNEEEFNTTTDFGSVLDNLQRRPFMP